MATVASTAINPRRTADMRSTASYGASTAPSPGVIGNPGLKHRQYDISSVNDGDTWTSGIRGIIEVFWQATDNGQECAVTVNPSTTVITFNVITAGRTGRLLVRSRA